MPRFANNNRLTFASSVKITLLSFAVALLFAGAVATVSGEDLNSPTAPLSRSKTNDDSQQQSKPTLFPTGGGNFGGGNLLSSLRFWEKENDKPKHKPTPSPASGNTAGKVVQRPPQPETLSQADSSPVGQANSVKMARSGATGLVPESSDNENGGMSDTRMSMGNAPLPANYAYVLSDGNTPTPRETRSEPISYPSYSYDARDWVEFFPIHEQEIAQEGVIVATTFKSPGSQLPQNPAYEDEHWNGHATTLPTQAPRNTVPNAITNAAAPFIPGPANNSPDLSPSYQKRLQHTTTCGVVVVQANFPLTEITSILDEINTLQRDLERFIGVPAPKEKIELCLFRDEDSYTRFLKEFFPNAPLDRRALFVKLDNKPGTLMVQKSKHFEIDLRHEMTHAIIHASIPKVPIWLDEGLAKYFEMPSNDRAGNNPYMTQVRWNARFGVPSLDRLAKMETIDDMGVKEYRDSWAWTHFLIHRSPETHRLLAGYLQMLAKLPEGKASRSRIPSLKLYLDDVVSNQREAFKEHFASAEK
jgi:hypothetical protein